MQWHDWRCLVATTLRTSKRQQQGSYATGQTTSCGSSLLGRSNQLKALA